jgi:hypothetical protein
MSVLSRRAQQEEFRRDELARQNQALERRLRDSVAEHADVRREMADVARQQTDLLAARLEQTSLELRRAQERAASLRWALVDAEAGHAAVRARAGRRGLRSWWAPTAASRKLAKRLLASGLFEEEFYREQYPDAPSAVGAAEHYVEAGSSSGYRPNAFFDTRWYLDRYEDVRRSGINPLLHYLEHGVAEGRDPGPNFQTSYYLEANPDVRERGLNPLAHYLRHGRQEGRHATRPE